MARLPLMSCGYPILRAAVEQMDCMAILNFALSSKKCRNFVKVFKKKIEFIWVNLQENDCVINVKLSKRREIYWKFRTSRDVLENSRKTDIFEIDQFQVENMRTQLTDKYIIQSFCQDDMAVCQRVAEVMLDVYIPEKLNYYISRPHDISNLLMFDELNKVNHLTFIVYFPISDKEFLLFREKVQPKKELTFNFPSYRNRKHECKKEFNVDRMEVCSSFWLNREDLFNINCKSSMLKKTSMTNEDMHLLIKRWQDGDDSKLESMKIEIVDADLDKLLDGIKTKTLAEIKEERNLENKTFKFLDFENFQFDGCVGRHLTRRDGKIATVHLKNDTINFLVWNKDSPKIT